MWANHYLRLSGQAARGPGSLSLHQQDVKCKNPEWSAKYRLKDGVEVQFNSAWYGVEFVICSGDITVWIHLARCEWQPGCFKVSINGTFSIVRNQLFHSLLWMRGLIMIKPCLIQDLYFSSRFLFYFEILLCIGFASCLFPSSHHCYCHDLFPRCLIFKTCPCQSVFVTLVDKLSFYFPACA